MAHSTLPELPDDRFPTEPEGLDALLKDVVDGLVGLWNCETRILKLQSEFIDVAMREVHDRSSLDLSA